LRLAIAAIIVLTVSAAAAEPELPAAIRDAIDRTNYTAEERTTLTGEAERAVRAGIPAEDVAAIIIGSSGRGAGSATARQFLDAAAKTQEQGLPARPVLNRIQQGLAKGVPADQVAAAADRLTARLQEARPIVDRVVESGVAAGSGRDREYATETVARALEKSLPPDAIAGAGTRVRDRKGSVALFDKAVGAMSGLVESGMEPASAARIVNDAISRGSSEKDLSKLEHGVSEGFKKERRSRDDGQRDRKEDRKKDRKKDRKEDRGTSGREDRVREPGSGHGGRER
jgi:hypothetical protein